MARDSDIDPQRRELLRLMLAASLIVTGCTGFRSDTELELYQEQLRALLDSLAEEPVERIQLASIGRRIEIRSRDLVAEHAEFRESFDSLMRTRGASS